MHAGERGPMQDVVLGNFDVLAGGRLHFPPSLGSGLGKICKTDPSDYNNNHRSSNVPSV